MAIAIASFAPAVHAQSAAADFTQDEIRSAARASLAVEAVNQKWEPLVREAQTQEDLNTIRREANAQMVQAIEAEGIDVDTYIEIIEAARTDQDLNEEFTRNRQDLQ